MPKYYYTDALKATYMAQEFKIKYSTKLEYEVVFEVSNGEQVNLLPEKIYIHPGCFNFLKPQVGDLVITLDEEPAFATLHLVQNGAITQIIQRQGKAWFNPEVEE